MSIRRSIAASLVGRYLGLVIGIGSSIVIARLLSPAEVGLFGVAFAAIAIATGLRHFGVVDYLVQLRELGRDDMGRAFAVTMGVALALAALVWGVRDWLAAYYGEPRLAPLLGLLAFNVLLSPFGIAALAVLQREYAFATLQVASLAGIVAGAVVAIVLAALGHGAASLAWGQLATSATQVGALALVRPRAVFCPPVLRGLGGILRFGGFRSMTLVVTTISDHVAPLVIGRGLGFAAVGLYDRAYGIEARVLDLVASATRPMFVALAEAKRDPARLRGFVLLSAGNLTAIVWPMLVLTAIMAEPIIQLLYGDAWRDAAPILRVMVLGGLAGILGIVPYELMTADGRTFTQMAIEWFGATLKIGLLLALVSHGLVAAAGAHAVALVVVGVLLWGFSMRRLGLGPGALATLLARSAAISLGAGAGPALLIAAGAPAALGSLPTLLLAGPLALAGWLLAAGLLRHTIYDEARLWFGSAFALLRTAAARAGS